MHLSHTLSLVSLMSLSAVAQVKPDLLFGGVQPLPAAPVGGTSECIAIDSTSVCAPWAAGLSINATALSAVYGLEGAAITNATYWDELVRATTTGGTLQSQMWTEYLQCPYSGEPIQYYRSYACLTDIYYYSIGCNRKPVSPPLHSDVCDVFAMAVKGIVDTCPKLETLAETKHFDESTISEIMERRSDMLKAKDSCKKILTDHKGSTDPEMWGVKDDQVSCGFGGHPDIGKKYCDDVHAAYGQTPKCCDSIPGYKAAPLKTGSTSGNVAALSAQQLEGAQGAPAPAQDLTVPIAGGVAGGLAAIVAVAAVVVSLRRRSGRNNKREIDTSDSEILAPSKEDTEAILARKETRMAPGTKRRVVHDYSADLHDEIDLKVGDDVEIESTFSDGWCRGKNLSSGQVGMFPSGVIEW